MATAKTYEQYRKERQEAFNALPIRWAYSDEQFKMICDELGASGPEDFYTTPALMGGFYLKSDAPVIRAYLEQPDELDALMGDYEFAKGAFMHEMNDHEYFINRYQGDWDVMSCFIDIEFKDEGMEGYLARSGWDEQTKQAYRDARRECYRYWCENDWF